MLLILFLLIPLPTRAQKGTEKALVRNPFIPQLPIEETISLKKEEPVAEKKPSDQKLPVAQPARNILEENRKEQQLKRERELEIERQRQEEIKRQQEIIAQENERKRKLEEEQKPPQVTITGIVWNTEKPQAIINGVVLNIGDTIFDSQNEEIKINKIYKTGIDVSYKGKTWTIKP
ncbi:MAG TPA: hypothetical protein PLH56_01355 [Candidatus Omnitrophota bacterium]|nr:hypothetical protein [Candidatus Omnitrophota bacterium]